MNTKDSYRNDIDGLRGISVISVILFHLGLMSEGYLGVDVFFCISGYLITGIILKERDNNSFKLTNFYLRRIRRILPLTFFISIISLLIGIIVMLPDDLENLSLSVIATNCSLNNVLQLITTRNYWDVINEFKPLLHTWSLGIEEQFYIFYPFIFIAIKNKKILLFAIISLIIASLLLFINSKDQAIQFYLIQYRLFELAAGGIAAILTRNKKELKWVSPYLIITLCFLLTFDIPYINSNIKLILVVITSSGILISNNYCSLINRILLTNRLIRFLGLISFSLYMWHQPLLAFTKYCISQSLSNIQMGVLLFIIFILSVFTYFLIERPFRNHKIINSKSAITILSVVFIISNSIAFYVYAKSGIVRNIPELDLFKSETTGVKHSKYNDKIFDYDRDFSKSKGTLKVYVIGNSYARDWVNVLLESKFSKRIEISYSTPVKFQKNRIEDSDVIFLSYDDFNINRNNLINLISDKKYYLIGAKYFGVNNGIFYHRKGPGYFEQRIQIPKSVYEKYLTNKEKFGLKYIDLIGKLIDAQKTIPVFTPDRKFFSHDCRHLTKAGARCFAILLDSELSGILLN